jgi:hypothetical protein
VIQQLKMIYRVRHFCTLFSVPAIFLLPGCTGSNPANTEIVNQLCDEVAAPYMLNTTALPAELSTASTSSGWGGSLAAKFSVAVDRTSNIIYVGFTRDVNGTLTATIASAGGIVAEFPGAICAGIAVTVNGVAALIFDPNTSISERRWAGVVRFDPAGNILFNTDLFRSPNLDDVGTKGAPSTGRFGYIAETDELVAYFGHTQRYDDGVRHQGGYLARISASGEQTLVSGWFGSHNLDQRLFIDGGNSAMLGLGDAYPEGIFYRTLNGSGRPDVLFKLAAAGNGTANGQLGGMVDLGDNILISFVTNNSIDQNINAGTWPDINEEVADMIRDAAANGNVIGLMTMPKGVDADSALEPVWLNPEISDSTRITRLKSAPYGGEGLTLLMWAESPNTGRNTSIEGYYSMVVNGKGKVCQEKTAVPSANLFTAGDDIVQGPGSSVVWANDESGAITIVTLTP